MAKFDFTVLMIAKDMASKTIGKVSKQMTGLQRAGFNARRGLTAMGIGLAAVGATAAVGLGRAIRSGLENLATLESATQQVSGAIRQMGLSGQVTAGQVAVWANQIEASVQAAFDDKDIVKGSAALIRYGKISSSNLRPAMVVMTDLAAKTGSVESAATALGKAMADPAKAAGALRRAGVILTKSQQDQIAALDGVNDKAKAQAMLLRILSKTTSGAAANLYGPYADSVNVLNDVTEDAQKALAEGFLPVLTRVRDLLGKAMGDDRFVAGLRDFGSSLAGLLDEAVTFVTKIPWDSVRAAISGIGTAAKIALDFFNQMPDWAKTLIIGGAITNKLSGGAVFRVVADVGGDIAGAIGKGIFSRGSTPANPLFTKEVGLGGGGGGSPLGKVGGLGLGTLGAAGLTAASIAAAVWTAWEVTRRSFGDNPGKADVTERAPIYAAGGSVTDPALAGIVRMYTRAPVRSETSTELVTKANQVITEIRNGFAVGRTTISAGDRTVGTEIRNGFVTNRTELRNGFIVNTAAERATAGAALSSAAASRSAAAAIRAKRLSWALRLSVPVSVRTTNTISVRNLLSQSSTYVAYSKATGKAGGLVL